MGKKQCVLIVDDNPEDLMPLICFLENHYDPVLVPEKSDCFKFAEKTHPDIILVDDMLKEPNCYDVCQGLKLISTLGSVPLILMSDLDAEELSSEVDHMGFDDYICKPINEHELLEKIETLLSFRQSR